MKPIETFMWCFVTASCFYWVPNLMQHCQQDPFKAGDARRDDLHEAWCVKVEEPNDNFNTLASLFWATEGGVIKNLMSNEIKVSLEQMVAFFSVWYFFTITTYGTNVPAGLFLPGMIIGCTLGDMYAAIMSESGLVDSTDDHWDDTRKKYIVIGCAAFMAGYTRMTYSLGVILMETSQDLSLFVPIIFTIIISNQTGYKFTRSLY
jgi:H+/Cl- antiporter ClcA